MANLIRRQDHWVRYSTPQKVLLQYEEPGWEFRELDHAPGGSFDQVTTRLHIASHLDPFRLRMGSPRKPFLLVQPSAAISPAGNHLAGSWEGAGRGRHILVSPGFVAATMGNDITSRAFGRRNLARVRKPDHSDKVIEYLMSSLASEIQNKNPGGSVFLHTVVAALVHYALQITADTPLAVMGKRGGLAPAKLRVVLDSIDAQLAGRPSLFELAALIGVGARYFCRAFRVSTGLSPHQYILRRRVELARDLIKNGSMSLSDVAFAAGFANHAHMTATFRRVLKITPSHFLSGSQSFSPDS
jgi:AraC family transcriptional regulator